MTTDSVAQSRPPIVHRDREHADRGYCYGVEDGLDGYCVHTASCIHVGHSASGPNSSCVQPGQDGVAMKTARDAATERRRFTPPEYRETPVQPAPAISAQRAQAVEVVALRGRPRLPGDTGKWTTWETFTAPRSGNRLRDQTERILHGRRPVEMSEPEAEVILATFAARVPTHEFKIVRARLTVVEEIIAKQR